MHTTLLKFHFPLKALLTAHLLLAAGSVSAVDLTISDGIYIYSGINTAPLALWEPGFLGRSGKYEIINTPDDANTSFANFDTIINYGELAVRGGLENVGANIEVGKIFNSELGTLSIHYQGYVNNTSELSNEGKLVTLSGGSLTNRLSMFNSGTLNNGGRLRNIDGAVLDNEGTVNNLSGGNLNILANSILNNNEGGKLVNEGTLTSRGTLNNNKGGALNNYNMLKLGEIADYQTSDNKSVLNNKAGATLTNYGTLKGGHLHTLNNSGIMTNVRGGIMEFDWGALNNLSGGELNNDGVLKINSSVTNLGTVVNTFRLYNNGALSNDANGTLTNDGGLYNQGSLFNHGTLTNNKTLINLSDADPLDSSYRSSPGELSNYGILNNNAGLVNEMGSLLFNSGTLNNNRNPNPDGGEGIELRLGSIFDNTNGIVNNRSVIKSYIDLALGSATGGTINFLEGSRFINHGNLSVIDGYAQINNGWLTNDVKGSLSNDGTLTNTGTLGNVGQLTNNIGGTLNNDGYLKNVYDGINGGTLDNFGTLNNTGLMINQFELNNHNQLINDGSLENHHMFINTGTVTNNGVLDNTGFFIQTAGSTIVNGTINGDGILDIQGGGLSGTGTIAASKITIGEEATVKPGNSPGTLIMVADVDLFGTLETEIVSSSVFDVLEVQGNVTLSDTSFFDFVFDDDYVGLDGDSFDFLLAFDFDFGSGASWFDWFDMSHFSVQGLDDALVWSISFTDNLTNTTASYLSLNLFADDAPDRLPINSANPNAVPAPGVLALFVMGLSLMGWSCRRSKLRGNLS